MPELPDLVYICKKLNSMLPGKKISGVEVKEPIVIRMLIPESFTQALIGKQFGEVLRHGPFLKLHLEPSIDIVVHFMLTGKFQFVSESAGKLKDLCFYIRFENGSILNYADKKRMGKIYVTDQHNFNNIPGYNNQGIDIQSSEFTPDTFRKLIEKKRQQARVFIMDQSCLSAIGNAYADEILFKAGIHPKTPCNKLNQHEIERLYSGIRRIMQWGIDEVEKADQPIEVKVREHLLVRNRAGQPCIKCGSTIRKAGVLGYDSFFCPGCQPFTGKSFIQWKKS